MKKIILVIGSILLLTGLCFAQAEQKFFRISDIYGEDAFIKNTEDPEFQPAILNMLLLENGIIKTELGRAEIKFDKWGLVRLDEKTCVQIIALKQNIIHLRIIAGRLYLRSSENGTTISVDSGPFRIDIDNRTECYLRPDNSKKLMITYKSNGSDFSAIIIPDLSAPEANVLLNKNIFIGNGEMSEEIKLTFFRRLIRSLSDNFYAYNRNREKALDDSEIAFLSRYGQWLTWNNHRVWIPHQSGVLEFYPNWYPYYYGRWGWYSSWGWTWLSYEPWGWLTYHYGSWLWTGWGWAWFADEAWTWRPAWVWWFGDDYYIGWYPWYPGWYYSWYSNYYPGWYPYQDGAPFRPVKPAMTMVRKEQLQQPSIGSRTEERKLPLPKSQLAPSKTPPNIRPSYKIIKESGKVQRFLTERDNLGRQKEIRIPETLPQKEKTSPFRLRQEFNERSYQRLMREVQQPDINPFAISPSNPPSEISQQPPPPAPSPKTETKTEKKEPEKIKK